MENETKKQNRILIWVIVISVMVIGSVPLIYYSLQGVKNFEFYGMKYTIQKEGEITFYKTAFVSNYVTPSRTVQYNTYLRKDPRVNNVSFDGGLYVSDYLVLQSDEEFVCNGDGVIAIANFNQIMGALGRTSMKDDNVTCEDMENYEGDYTLIKLINSSETKVVQTGYSCYDLHINNCEILEVTERFLVEVFSALPESYKIQTF